MKIVKYHGYQPPSGVVYHATTFAPAMLLCTDLRYWLTTVFQITRVCAEAGTLIQSLGKIRKECRQNIYNTSQTVYFLVREFQCVDVYPCT